MQEELSLMVDTNPKIKTAQNLIEKIKSTPVTLEEKGNCLFRIWKIAENDRLKFPLCHPSLGLLPLCKHLLITETDPTCIDNVLNILWFLSRDFAVKPLICSRDLGLLPVLVRYLSSDYPRYRNIHKCLSNCSQRSSCHDYLLNEEIGYIAFCKRQYFLSSDNCLILQSIFCLVNELDNSTIHHLLNYNFHIIILLKLLPSGGDPSRWVDRHTGAEYWCLNFLTSLSTIENGSLALLNDYPNGNEYFPFSFFYDIMNNSTRMESVKAMIIISNLIYYKASSGSLLSPAHQLPVIESPKLWEQFHCPQCVFSLFFSAMATTALYGSSELDSSTGFGYGILKLRDFSSALFHMIRVCPSQGLHVLSQVPVLQTVQHLISLFINNSPECSQHYQITNEGGGGGGKDYETMEYSLLLSYHLILYYDRIIKTMKRLESNVEEPEILRELSPFNEIPLVSIKRVFLKTAEGLQTFLRKPYRSEETEQNSSLHEDNQPRFIPKRIILLVELYLGVVHLLRDDS
jgi:hypothetical protein